jgi:hypothetical protein
MARKPVQSVTTLSAEAKQALYDKISEWHKAKAKAAEWTAKEMELRKELVATYFKDGTEGTNNFNLEWGKQLKADIKVNRTVVKDQLNAILVLERQRLAEDPNYKSNIMPIIDTIVEYEPKLVVGEYKKLDAEQQKQVADLVTVKEGAPGLSLETPKT